MEPEMVEPNEELDLDEALDRAGGPGIDLTRLYKLWEGGNWSAFAIDLRQDAIDWRERLTPKQRQASRWNYAMFVHGEEAVARTLAPFVTAALTQEQRIFLTTQIVDEARHHVFFDRFMREVMGEGDSYDAVLDAVRPELTPGFRRVFNELDRLTDQLRRQPANRALYAQCIALYHVVVEGTLAHPGQRFMLEYMTRDDVMPGFRSGIARIARDESRHMAFGIQALGELVASSPIIKRAVIRALDRVLPWAVGVLTPPGLDFDYLRAFGVAVEDLYAFSLKSLEAKLTRAGIAPGEVMALVKLGASDPPSVQAERALAMMKAGMVSDAVPLDTSEASMALLFAAVERVARARPVSSFPGSIQWELAGAEPWYLAVESGMARVRRGRVAAPALTLRATAVDWASVATQRLDPRWALATRRMSVSGDWRLALRLPALLGA
ncbi:MAG TPA: ribonucleotide-diphosphate reductase subunit beta [Ktedonobacterales bacterium]